MSRCEEFSEYCLNNLWNGGNVIDAVFERNVLHIVTHLLVLTFYHMLRFKDIPGKYTKSKKSALTREMSLIKRMLEYHTKIAVFDIIRWKSPLLSSYLFFAWMYFVWLGSFKLVPAFIMSLLLIFMMKNYLKYYVNSPAARIFGHKSIEEMTHMLLFKDSSNADKSNVCLRRKNSTLERVLFKVFGLSETTLDSWRFEDHAEYPFSRGTADPKLSSGKYLHLPLLFLSYCGPFPTIEMLLYAKMNAPQCLYVSSFLLFKLMESDTPFRSFLILQID